MKVYFGSLIGDRKVQRWVKEGEIRESWGLELGRGFLLI